MVLSSGSGKTSLKPRLSYPEPVFLTRVLESEGTSLTLPPSTHPSIHPSSHPFISPSIYPSLFPSIHPSNLSIHPFTHPSILPAIPPSLYHSLHLFLHLYLHPSIPLYIHPSLLLGFPHSSVGKSSACNAGDLGLIPGSGRSPGEGNGYPLQYSCRENLMDRGA